MVSYLYLCAWQIVIVLKSFILAMISHPGVLARAQQEIDSVVGKDRLPTFEDRDSLPYINGLVHEAIRSQTLHIRPLYTDKSLHFQMEPPCTARFEHNSNPTRQIKTS
jgi:Cytochrome P450